MINRWFYEPFGMWDAWAMWNLKSKFLFSSIVNFSEAKLFDNIWHHMDYPLTLPFLHVSFALSFGYWTQYITYFLNSIFFLLSVLIFFKSISKKFIITPLILIFGFVTNPFYLKLASDLCADHYLALFLLSFIYAFNSVEKDINKSYLWSSTVAISLFGMSIIKNEGFLYAILAILIFSFYNFLCNNKIITKHNLNFLFLFIFILLINFLWKFFVLIKIGSIESDFVFLDFNLIWKRVIDINSYQLIFSYFYNFQFLEMKGILIFTLIFLFFFSENKITKIMTIYFIFLLFLLNFLFLFSKNINWHLSTAYNRINLVIYPSVLYLWILNSREYFNFKSNSLRPQKEISS